MKSTRINLMKKEWLKVFPQFRNKSHNNLLANKCSGINKCKWCRWCWWCSKITHNNKFLKTLIHKWSIPSFLIHLVYKWWVIFKTNLWRVRTNIVLIKHRYRILTPQMIILNLEIRPKIYYQQMINNLKKLNRCPNNKLIRIFMTQWSHRINKDRVRLYN